MADESHRSEKTIKKYMYWSMGAGLIPMPAIDVAAVLAIQLRMVAVLARQYGQEFSRDSGKAFIASLVGGTAPTAASVPVASLIKRIPVIGQTAGVLAMPALAGASTYAVGKVFVQHFESGGTFLTFDPDKVRSHYEAHLETGAAAAGG
jgi:uncharacterized protein (DUF697 family)